MKGDKEVVLEDSLGISRGGYHRLTANAYFNSRTRKVSANTSEEYYCISIYRTPGKDETMDSSYIKDICARCNGIFEEIQSISETKSGERYFENGMSKSEMREADYQFKVKCYNYGVFSTGPTSLGARMVEPDLEETVNDLWWLESVLEQCKLWKP